MDCFRFCHVVGSNSSGGAGQVTLLGGASIANRAGINTVSIGGGVNGIEFQPDTTDSWDSLFTIWKGMVGYWDGDLFFDANGIHAMSISGNGKVNFGTSFSGTTVYYCSTTGVLARGNSGTCTGGTWQATNITLQ